MRMRWEKDKEEGRDKMINSLYFKITHKISIETLHCTHINICKLIQSLYPYNLLYSKEEKIENHHFIAFIDSFLTHFNNTNLDSRQSINHIELKILLPELPSLTQLPHFIINFGHELVFREWPCSSSSYILDMRKMHVEKWVKKMMDQKVVNFRLKMHFLRFFINTHPFLKLHNLPN